MRCHKYLGMLGLVFICACTTNQQAAKSFSVGYQPVKESVNQTIQTIPKTRRLLGIEHYLKGLPTGQNSYGGSKTDGKSGASQDETESFSNFVCAGVETTLLTRRANLLINGVTKGLAELSADPPKEVGALWEAIGKVKTPGLRVPQDDFTFQECITQTQALIRDWYAIPSPPEFKRDAQLEQEFAPQVGLSVAIMAYEALQKLVVWSEQSWLSLKREAAIEQLLVDKDNRKELLNAFAILTGPCKLPADEKVFDNPAQRQALLRQCEQDGIGRLYKRHKQTLLLKPHLHYVEMLSFDKSLKANEIRLRAIQIDEELQAFDQAIVAANPGFLASKAQQQFQKLLDVIDRKGDWKDAFDQLVIFARLVNDMVGTAGKIEGQLNPKK